MVLLKNSVLSLLIAGAMVFGVSASTASVQAANGSHVAMNDDDNDDEHKHVAMNDDDEDDDEHKHVA